ncbi:MAG: NAD-dependent epimerase/dehydratase family protein, partial [Mucilaginibacter sp.]
MKTYHNEDISKKRFLVTGGAGFIGSHLVEYLLQHNAAKVRVLDDFSTGYYHNIKQFRDNPAFEFIEGDIRDVEMCNEVMRGMDYVLHQAALGSAPRSIADPAATNDVNITGFLNVLTAAKDAHIKRMVYAASSSTYGDSKELPKV